MTSFSTTRRVLAVMAVTTAICADQTVIAAQAARPQTVEIGQLASRLVSRLARNFQRSLPAVIRQPVHQQRAVESESVQPLLVHNLDVAHATLSPFQFRLPPPAV